MSPQELSDEFNLFNACVERAGRVGLQLHGFDNPECPWMLVPADDETNIGYAFATLDDVAAALDASSAST